LDVDGDLSIHAGTLDVSGQDIELFGDWLNTGGVFDDEEQTVTLNGNDQAIDFSETFSNFNKSVTTTGTLTIGKDSTMTIDVALSLNGAPGNLLGVASSTIGTKHTWDVTAGSQSVSYLNVKDSQATSNNMVATYSTNIGRNDDAEATPHWIFASTFFWINALGGDTNDAGNWASAANACGVGGGAGVPGVNDVATFQANCDDNATVDVNMIVAALDIQSGYTGIITPDSGVSIDVNGPFTQAGGTIDFSVNNTDLNVSGNFTKTGGTFTAGTGITTFDGALSVNVDAGTNLGNVLVSSSPDVSNVTMTSDLTVNDLTIGAGDTLATDGFELTMNNDLDLDGFLDATNGTDGNTTIDIAGNWDATSGTFTNVNSTVRFTGISGTSDIISAGGIFNNLIIDDGGGTLTVELEDALDVDGTLTIMGGTLDANATENNAISISGNWDNNDTFTPRSGNVTVDGSSSQTIAHGSGTFSTLTVTNGTDTVHLANHLQLQILPTRQPDQH